MPVTRSRQGKEEQSNSSSRDTGASGTSGTEASSAATTSDSRTTATTTETTTATETTTQTRPARSRKSTSAKRLAVLEAEEQLAELRAREARTASKLAEAKLRRLRAEQEEEEDSCSDKEQEDLQSVRITEWLGRKESGKAPAEGAEKPGAAQAQTRAARDERGAGENRAEMGHGQQAQRDLTAPRPTVDLEMLTTALAQLARGNKRYDSELPIFDGRHTGWLAFRSAFQESADAFTRADNIGRLRKSLRGPAYEAVSCLMLGQPEPQAIIEALERRFGRPETLVLAEMEKLRGLPRVSQGAREVCVFAGKVANTVATIEALGREAYLHSPEITRSILEKLTPILQSKWYDYASFKKEDMPELKKMAAFLNDEADKCGAYALPETAYEDGGSQGGRGKRPQKAFVAAATTTRCPLCEKVHPLSNCSDFLSYNIQKRWDAAKKSGTCFLCLSERHRRFKCQAKECDRDGCGRRHHRLLHSDAEKPEPQRAEAVASTTTPRELSRGTRTAFLKIAEIELITPSQTVSTYALLDEGSTFTFVEESLVEALGVRGPTNTVWIRDANGGEVRHDRSQKVNLRVRGKHAGTEYIMHEAQTVKHLDFTTQTVNERDLEGCDHLTDLANELTYDQAAPKVIIGQDNWHLIVSRKIREGREDQPVASLTHLGWILHGCAYRARAQQTQRGFCGHVTGRREETLEVMMKDFFKLESIGIEPKRPVSDPEQQAIRLLDEKSQRRPDGRFETGLLWRGGQDKMPNNYESAMKRLITLEAKLDKDADLKGKYKERVDNLLKSGYAEQVSTPPKEGHTWYLPHFAVVNPAKPKIRLVHDAAAKYMGKSLNDRLLAGPDLLQSLPGVIMRFWQHELGVSADIKEMFMQIKILEEDRDALRFLWRGDRREGAPEEFRMTSVIFGASSSPSTALYIKNRNAQEHADKYPAAARAIIRNHYMDDYLQSFETEEAAIRTVKEVDLVHRKAGFELRGWTANNRSVLCDFSSKGETTVAIGGSDVEKALGLLWDVTEDTLGYRVNSAKTPVEVATRQRPPTKREALSVIMALFDPLGLISPITTPGKRIMQDTWRYGSGWDEPIPAELRHRWNEWYENLRGIEQLKVPRCYDATPVATRELHTFVDASEEAYAAAVYWRAIRADGTVSVTLAAAKSRVTPLKPTSIPRLELQAALLGARLAETVESEHDWKATRRVYWSDSRTALAWIRSEPRTYKTFVAHRLAEIEDLTKKDEWRWVPTGENVADDATRAAPENFTARHRWFLGPAFLYNGENTWPVETHAPTRSTGEEKVTCAASAQVIKNTHLPLINRFSSWLRLIRATARVLQFVARCREKRHEKTGATRKRTRANADSDPRWEKVNPGKKGTKIQYKPTTVSPRRYVGLEAHYITTAEKLWIAASQRESFADEIRRLKARVAPSSGDRLATLSVYFDTDDTLRLKGRVVEARDIDGEATSPAVIDGKHPYSRLYIQHVHERLHHGGVETTVNELRQRFWIVRIRPAVRDVIKSCPVCRLKRAKPMSPATGDLPSARLAHHTRAFTFSGLDYFGPLSVTVGRRQEKRYVALFTCLSSRAIHLEVAHSLSTDSAICALRRFIARRGCPSELWSDNATCFRAADKELRQAIEDGLHEEAANRGISWRFIPPAAPFMGGAWERMVRSVKEALRHTLHTKAPSDEILSTLLAEVECTVNSRPLTHVAVTPDDPEALTPNHILMGANSHVPSPATYTEDGGSARQHWRRAQHLADTFWRRWVREYLPLLQHRREPESKGQAPKVGDLVIIGDEHSPRNTWPRGVITALHPGNDGIVRVVDVTMSGGNVLRRPTRKVVVLPVDREAATAGEMCKTTTSTVD